MFWDYVGTTLGMSVVYKMVKTGTVLGLSWECVGMSWEWEK